MTTPPGPNALLALLRLGAATRWRLRGPYWAWRWRTAWGPAPKPSRADRFKAALDYAAWSARMRALSRPKAPSAPRPTAQSR